MTILETKETSAEKPGPLARFLKILGPGFITGASDDDPSGIGTYSQAGAQFGYGIGWTILFTFPLMSAIQEISARIGRTTGHGIAGNVCRHYPASILYVIVGLLFIANAINIGADLNAMADAIKMLIGGSSALYVILLAGGSVAAIIFLTYKSYVRILKWTTLGLFSYVATLFAVDVSWKEAISGLFIPKIDWAPDFFTMLVAVFGTTISPYLFFWQASMEVEEIDAHEKAKPLKKAPEQAPKVIEQIRADTLLGMAFSSLIAIAIIITTAATLNRAGITNIESSVQAAEALKPIAGPFAFVLFALGIVSTGLLAIPVLAGSAAYAVGEACKWPVGISKKPRRATAFYGILAGATALGVVITFVGIDPIKALYWSAVINGAAAVPIMIMMMLMTRREKVMGEFVIGGWLRSLGWVATAAMALCVLGMVAGWLI
ncbi:MAG: divalent metal cation transporter [Rhizobiales bacterium]|nr:divalent metal cation transporter [Hyphomicrobiales bacterium]MCW5684529.1 divalent metal cation transporter [Pseudolabrys sp.]OJY41864.1 MAG: iron transporter [Rhizobiales bacterium 64-17]